MIIFTGTPGSGKSVYYKKKFLYPSQGKSRYAADPLQGRKTYRILPCLWSTDGYRQHQCDAGRKEKVYTMGPIVQVRITGYFFQSSLKTALERNRQRTGKERIKDIGVIAKYRQLQAPSYQEGYDELHEATIDGNGEFIVNKLDHKKLPG